MGSVGESWQKLLKRGCLTDSTTVSLQIDEFFAIGTFLSSQRLRHLIHFVGSLSVGPRLSVQLS